MASITSSYARNYYNKHRVKILEDQRKRRRNEDYRDKLKKYYKEYYRKNRLKILKQAKTRRVDFNKPYDDSNTLKITRGVFTISFT